MPLSGDFVNESARTNTRDMHPRVCLCGAGVGSSFGCELKRAQPTEEHYIFPRRSSESLRWFDAMQAQAAGNLKVHIDPSGL